MRVYVMRVDCRHESIVVLSSERRIDGRLPTLCCPHSSSFRFESNLCSRNYQPAVLTEDSRLVRRASQTTRSALSASLVRLSTLVTLVDTTRSPFSELLIHGDFVLLESRHSDRSYCSMPCSTNGMLLTRWESSTPVGHVIRRLFGF